MRKQCSIPFFSAFNFQIASYYNPVADLRMTQELLRAESQGKLLGLRMDADHLESQAFASLVGLSESQLNHFQTKYKEFEEYYSEHVEKSLSERMENLNLSPEELTVLENDISQLFSETANHLDEMVRETLTPEQLQRAREIDLALPSILLSDEENDFSMNFAAYDVFDLSEEQREAFEEMHKEWDQEFQKFFEDAKSQLAGGDKDIEDEVTEKLKQISKKYKAKIDATLTPEQKEKLAQLRKEIPEKLAALQSQGETQVAEQDDSWKNSWKPGDPLPKDWEHLAQPATPRFPVKKEKN